MKLEESLIECEGGRKRDRGEMEEERKGRKRGVRGQHSLETAVKSHHFVSVSTLALSVI